MSDIGAKKLTELADKYGSKTAINMAVLREALMSADPALVSRAERNLSNKRCLEATKAAMKSEGLWVE